MGTERKGKQTAAYHDSERGHLPDEVHEVDVVLAAHFILREQNRDAHAFFVIRQVTHVFPPRNWGFTLALSRRWAARRGWASGRLPSTRLSVSGWMPRSPQIPGRGDAESNDANSPA